MVAQKPTIRTGRHAHVSAFLCGTFALALGLVLVLDPDDDDDQPLLITTPTLAETQAKPAAARSQKHLKVAKTHKLKPKKTAFKKRSKRFFHMTESGTPVQANQRPRRGFCETFEFIQRIFNWKLVSGSFQFHADQISAFSGGRSWKGDWFGDENYSFAFAAISLSLIVCGLLSS